MTDELLEIQIFLESYINAGSQLNLLELENTIRYEFITSFPRVPIGRNVLTPFKKFELLKHPRAENLVAICYYEEVQITQVGDRFLIKWLDVIMPKDESIYAPEELTLSHSELLDFLHKRYNEHKNLYLDKYKPGRYYINDGICDVPHHAR
jgi:hypothetical protein